MSEKITCLCCGGRGWIEVYVEAGCPFIQEPCPDCGGKGVVPVEEEVIPQDFTLARALKAEAAVEAAIDMLVGSEQCPPDYAEGCVMFQPDCYACWGSWLDQQGKEAKKA